MKTTTIDIGAPSPRQICSNAGLLAFARTATNLAVADTIDDALTGRQNPNLTHTVGSTMTSLALALLLGGDDVNDIELLDPLVATGLITHIPSDCTIHRRHHEFAELRDDVRAPLTGCCCKVGRRTANTRGTPPSSLNTCSVHAITLGRAS